MSRRKYSAKNLLLWGGIVLFFVSVKWLVAPAQYLAQSVYFAVASPSQEENPICFDKNLELENNRLKEKLSLYEQLIEQNCHLIAKLAEEVGSDTKYPEEKKLHHTMRITKNMLSQTPAVITYRSPDVWSSTLWIALGHEHNPPEGEPVIGINSPVVWGNTLVGVVEFVGKKQSRVRLITDSALTPSVRVLREEGGSKRLSRQVQVLISQLTFHTEIFPSAEDKSRILSTLAELKTRLGIPPDELYLAKGEVHGSGAPLGRKNASLLYGEGFNYDFADEEGPSRDLRTGREQESYNDKEIPLVQEGDLLITTGYDGIFPKGLNVGIVEKVYPLEEGDFSYRLTAKPCAQNIQDLSCVVVLPPQEFSTQPEF